MSWKWLTGEISARLGSSWIPTSDIRDFITETLNMTKSAVKVAHAGAIATWAVSIESYARDLVSNTTTHGTGRFPATELIDQALNGRVPTAYDRLEDGTHVINQMELFYPSDLLRAGGDQEEKAPKRPLKLSLTNLRAFA